MTQERVDIGQGLEPLERTFGRDLFPGLQDPTPCGAGERVPYADPSYAVVGSFGDVEKRSVDQHVDRFGRYRCDDRGDVLGADARSVEAVRSGFGVRAQPPDRLIDVGTPAHESLGPSGQHDAGPALVDGASRRRDTLDGQIEL